MENFVLLKLKLWEDFGQKIEAVLFNMVDLDFQFPVLLIVKFGAPFILSMKSFMLENDI